MAKQHDFFAFGGGLDINTPYLQRSPGWLINGLNYEPDPDGGYRRIPGFERFDGQPSPTETVVVAIQVDGLITPPPAIGQTITGSISGATGQYLTQDFDNIYVINAVGEYQAGDVIVGTFINVTANSADVFQLVDYDYATSLYRQGREYNRSQIQEVPGINEVRAVYEHEGVVYAIRDDVGGSVSNVYKSSPTGWQLISFANNHILYFDGGLAGSDDPFLVGNIVTGLNSTAYGEVIGFGVTSADRQSGYIALKNVYLTFDDNEPLQVGGVTVAYANGTLQNQSLEPGGDYKIISHNFYGSPDTYNMFIVNGQQEAMMFDGEALCPILTGLDPADEKPFDIAVHYDHLFLAYAGGTLQHSVQGEPINWRGDLGAFEFALGAEITNMIVSPRSLVVTTVDNAQVIYGSDVATWEKAFITNKGIGVANTGQYLARPLILDRAGVLALDRVDAYGNYQDAIISDQIRGIFNRIYNTISYSSIDKLNNHYILYGGDGYNMLTGFSNNQFIGFFPLNYGVTVRYASNHERRKFFCCNETGYAYINRVGTSFDGEDIESYLQTSYAFQQQPQRKKRYRRVTISLKSFSFVELAFTFSFSKGDSGIRSTEFTSSVIGGGGRWDIDNWDEIVWDAQDVPEIFSEIDGVGTGISTILYTKSAEISSFVIEDITIEYSPRALKR